MAATPADPSPRPRARPRPRPRPSPNPLFTRWLREWRDEALAAGGGRHVAYERALRSLARYPLPLRSGAAASVLRNFGPGICGRLERRLREQRRDEGSAPSAEGRGPPSPLAPPTKLRPFRPRPRSAPFALLVTLLRSPAPLGGAELLAAAQPLCARPLSTVSALSRDQSERDGAVEAPPEEADFELKPGEFDVVLCVDSNEAARPHGGAAAILLRPPSVGSRVNDVPVMVRHLPVGDFLFVARERDPPPGHAPRELCLDVVVERKRAGDLGGSVRDGRYREQKLRLRRSGLRRPLLLLEEAAPGERLPLPEPVLRQAALSAQPQRVGDVFVRQLLQVPGLGGGGAAAIARSFGTPARLLAAYGRCPEAERGGLLRGVKCGRLQRNLGPALSRTLALLYGSPSPLR
ncbi:crossover junction endonuclease MUS81 [Eudromia elegans]